MHQSAQHNLELLVGMTDKELRVRYKRTIFGFLWLVANPILQMIIIGFIFPLFVKEPIPHYNYYLFTGLLVWNFFSLSLAKAVPSIVNERMLIKKAAFPRAIIPLSIILSNLVHFLAAFALFLIPASIIHTLTLDAAISGAAAIVLLTFLTIGFTLLTSALNVKYRDVNFFVQALLIVWFYATPLIYTLKQIPPDLLWLWNINPLTSILALLQHATTGTVLPDGSLLLANVGIISLLFIVGLAVFSKESKNFDDWL
jgi:ABC-type polysaccharide/polyol phosphate export permease